MFDRHFKVWPQGVPRQLTVPETTLHYNLEVSATRYPHRDAIIYYGKRLSYRALHEQVERLAGYLQRDLAVAKGDRVLLYMQNSPQFVIGYYAILRADAIVIPVNPMNRQAELEYLVEDADAKVALVGQELWPLMQQVRRQPRCIVASYGEYADPNFDLPLPDAVAASTRRDVVREGAILWQDALVAGRTAAPSQAQPDDLAVFPYSSGTTGRQKGCMHTHRTVMTTLVGGLAWLPLQTDTLHLASLPLFHVTGMQSSMNQPLYAGSTIVIMARWDRRLAAELIQRYRISRWRCISTMIMDLVNDPEIDKYDLSSLNGIGGGGAALPEAVVERLEKLVSVPYIEGYGLSETIAATHINPPDRPKAACLGIPVFDVDARILSVDTGKELPPHEVGEIIINAPQVFKGYWNNPTGTREAFIELDGKQFLRTGDLGYYDENGYFFIVDRLKRMINAAGYKVWPSEVESLMLRHPAIAEVCVIATPDPRRGESVKAVVVLRPNQTGVTADDILRWCRNEIAAYKCPTVVELAQSLPRSGAGKVQWRELQELEFAKAAQRADAR
jgi:fatty-acyl-CoA synthase